MILHTLVETATQLEWAVGDRPPDLPRQLLTKLVCMLDAPGGHPPADLDPRGDWHRAASADCAATALASVRAICSPEASGRSR
jgi:hypothetical protein